MGNRKVGPFMYLYGIEAGLDIFYDIVRVLEAGRYPDEFRIYPDPAAGGIGELRVDQGG